MRSSEIRPGERVKDIHFGEDTLAVDLAPWPALQQFRARVAGRTAVKAALKAEGLAK